PNDPIRTARVTSTLQRLDTNLRALATRRDIGYADILGLTIDLLPDDPYCLGGVPFINQGSDSGDPLYLWLGGELSQNFHPNTNGQAIVANAIISAYNEKYELGVTPFSEFEIVETLLGLQTPLSEWAESFGLGPDDRGPDDDPELDGLNNLIEFALGLDPSAPSALPMATMVGDTLLYEYELAAQAYDQLVTAPEYSHDLTHWQPVPAEQITAVSENRFRISLTSPTGVQYLRLKVQFRSAGSL
ncbi:MAG: hypothetical protein ACR2RV_19655, partial [Verrucomicrobiales bacterium]